MLGGTGLAISTTTRPSFPTISEHDEDQVLTPYTSLSLISADIYRKHMVAIGTVVVGGIISLICLYYAYRLSNIVRLYRYLFGLTSDNSPVVVDGQPVTVEGVVTVDEEAPASDRATDGQPSPIAMYVWRAAFSRNGGGNRIDFKDREIKQSKSTFASGVEFGSFALTTQSGDVHVDPSWLRDAHDAKRLSEVRPVGVNPSRTWHIYLWRSPYVCLNDNLTEMSLERLRDVIDMDGSDVSVSDYYFMSKAVPEGTRLTVHGEVAVRDGTPTIKGTDDTPLIVSDGGIDAVGNALRRRAFKLGAYLVLGTIGVWIFVFA